MGKKDNKKKVKGAEKTAAKTEKKLNQKIKKDLKAKGEDDIDTLLAQFAEEDRQQAQIVEELCKEAPSKRSAFSLTPHPDKEQLILFGGEHFNGTQTLVYNDLFTYTIKQNRWHRIISPGGPPPRCSHQAVTVPQNGGQMFVFGGEFTSKSQSQFYHYKDLWLFSFATKKWDKISAKDGPSGRSGHRMVASKKKLIVFGGFHDNGYEFKYYNDAFAFDLENYKWQKLEVSGNAPAPRSACGMAAMNDGKVLIYGGYSRVKTAGKKEASGITHTDMFYLQPDKHDTSGVKYKWVSVKQSGDKPEPSRCSFAFSGCVASGVSGGWGEDKAILFGGVNDQEEEDEDEEMEGQFFDELYLLDMTKGHWSELNVTGKKDADEEEKKKRRRKAAGDKEEEMEVADQLCEMQVEAEEKEEEPTEIVKTDGVFTLTQTVGTSSQTEAEGGELGATLVRRTKGLFVPPPRISGGVCVRRGSLYLYGGLYEEAEKQLTLNDFYSLDLSKMEEWRTIKALNRKDLEWFDSESESEEDDEEEESD